ncbi:MAG: heterodisulfide reductase-related iron-sulfur binding cluster [Candidatus Helarchaeota archaeon]
MVLSPQVMIPTFISYLLLYIIAAILLVKKKMNRKISILILFASLIIPGFIFGALAGPFLAIQQIIINFYSIIQNPSMMGTILPLLIGMSLVLIIFIIITILFGRTFCGYVCPLGAAQELVSKISFKSKVKKSKYKINIPRKLGNYIRLGFFIAMIILALGWGISLFELMNPFNTFTIFKNLFNITTIIIPLILFSIIIFSSFFIYRPWCRLVCPFGTISWLTSRFSIFKFRRSDECTNCKACEKVCPTNEALLISNKSECYECNRCVDICPVNAIKYEKKQRKDCPAEEVNPEEFKKPIKVKLQSILFPIISKIKKLPPAKRKWNYTTSSWEIIGMKPGEMKPMGMKPGEMKPMGMKPGEVKPMGMKPGEIKPMGMRPSEMKPMGMKPGETKPMGMKPGEMKPMGMKPGEKLKLLYNCIHCNRCRTSESRIKLKQHMFKRGQVPNDFESLFHSYEKYKTPLNQNSMRIKKFNEIPKESSTLLFLGCFSSIKTPRLAEHAIQYLLSQNVHFTILENEICCGLSLKISGEKKLFDKLQNENIELFKTRGFKEIICICPACYNMFRKDYKMSGINIKYIIDYLKPLNNEDKTLKNINIQHSCHLLYEGKKKLVKQVEKTLENSGFHINKVPHWCCGGGQGQIYITDTIEKIGRIRVNDFSEPILTTYCPSCYWMLKVYGKKEKRKYKLVDIYQLLTPGGFND